MANRFRCGGQGNRRNWQRPMSCWPTGELHVRNYRRCRRRQAIHLGRELIGRTSSPWSGTNIDRLHRSRHQPAQRFVNAGTPFKSEVCPMLLSMRVRSGHETEGEGGGPAGGWGSIRAVAGDPSRSRDPRQRNPAEAEQAGRLHVREMLLGEAGKAAPLRVLRERCEGNGMEITNKLVAPVFFAEHTHTGIRSPVGRAASRVAGTEDLEILGTMFFVADCFGMKDEGGSDGFERQKDRNSRRQWFRAGGT